MPLLNVSAMSFGSLSANAGKRRAGAGAPADSAWWPVSGRLRPMVRQRGVGRLEWSLW